MVIHQAPSFVRRRLFLEIIITLTACFRIRSNALWDFCSDFSSHVIKGFSGVIRHPNLALVTGFMWRDPSPYLGPSHRFQVRAFFRIAAQSAVSA